MKDILSLALFAALIPLQASTLDVSASQTVVLHGGESLTFELLTGSYAMHAQEYGLPAYPASFQFALVSAPLNASGEFAATLTSSDASKSVALDAPLRFSPGYFSGAGYQGAVSTLQGQIQLASQLSQELFGGGSVQLHLLNLGGDLTLGLSPLPLAQDLYSSLSSGGLSVGATTAAVTQKTLNAPLTLGALQVQPFALAQVPEPGTTILLLGAGALLMAFSRVSTRLARVRR